MRHETLHIFPEYPNANLVTYLHCDTPNSKINPRRAIIVCPGGGYAYCCGREDEPIALPWMAEGFQAFVLHYGVEEHAANYEPLIEACLAVRYVREHAEEWNIDPAHIFITGFSAGGHCAASAGTLWNLPCVADTFERQYGDRDTRRGRPDATILCYPVITSGIWAHRPSFLKLCGKKDATEEEQARFSLEDFVDHDTAPAFLWHTADDGAVPVQNSLLYAMALAANHVPYELHIFPHGPHGLSLCDERTWAQIPQQIAPSVAVWLPLAIRFAKELA